jgi:hypothetical protein
MTTLPSPQAATSGCRPDRGIPPALYAASLVTPCAEAARLLCRLLGAIPWRALRATPRKRLIRTLTRLEAELALAQILLAESRAERGSRGAGRGQRLPFV